jgi:hypothetical protein
MRLIVFIVSSSLTPVWGWCREAGRLAFATILITVSILGWPYDIGGLDQPSG